MGTKSTDSRAQENWVSRTPRTPAESLLQIEHVRNSIRATHEDANSVPLFEAMISTLKDHELPVYSQVFMSNHLNEILATNLRLSTRAKQKRKHVQKGNAGLVGEEDFEPIRVEKEAAAHQKRVEPRSGDTGQPGVRKKSAYGCVGRWATFVISAHISS
ncbi:hypothetical protein EV44_g3632 [Erysiphe necator]|uniref:Uncharacterized protein n=1 Tax=Uncinula necator TaxID=52586 RepID=A0A0B1PHQ2_UNCNE|nr:hypothetical protein EV44_g3632 [Erysiphe necator]